MMKAKTVALTLIALALSAPAVAKAAKQGVFSPEPGVVCDKVAKFCSDEQGISIGMTEMHLGAPAAKAFSDMIAQVGDKNFDSKVFVLSNGVMCDTNTKKCSKSKYDNTPDAKTTGWLFGMEDPAVTYNHLEGQPENKARAELKKGGFKMRGATPNGSEIWFNHGSKGCLEIYHDSGLIGSVQAASSALCR
ncbi:MAG: YcgJ family protein [Plesiomonas shigelloides]